MPRSTNAASGNGGRGAAEPGTRYAARPAGRPRSIDPAEVAATLGRVRTARSARIGGFLRWAIPAVLAVATAAIVLRMRSAEAPVVFETQAARRGDLAVTVIATGTLAPLDTVSVGTEVSGTVDVVAVDYNDRVRRGQTLAVVNTDQLRAQIRQQEAAVAAAEASARQAAATLAETRPQAGRAESLFAQAIITLQELEAARAALARAEAAQAQADAQVAAARAALENQRTALGKATIRSPIDGIVLQRHVEPGRTVTASFQTPVLFVLAVDLHRMTLALDVDEADIGTVLEGQEATFTVDAWPGETFAGRVRSVRNAAKTVEGVVTYPTILEVENDRLLLRPGMTATATITTTTVRAALLVPAAALRFTPADTDPAPAGPRVWTPGPGGPVAIAVTTGVSDGQWTQITGGDVAPGTPLIVGTGADNADSPAANRAGPIAVPGLPGGGPRVR